MLTDTGRGGPVEKQVATQPWVINIQYQPIRQTDL